MSKEYRAYAHPDLGPYYGRLRQPRTNFYRNTTSNTWELLGTSALSQYSLTTTQDTSADYAYYADRPTGVTSDDDVIFEIWRGDGATPTDADQIADANYDSILISAIDTLLDAIKAKTDNLPASPAAVGSSMALTSSERNSVADAVLNRGASNVENSADRHSLGAVVMIATNASVSATTLTAKKPSDDSTFQTYTVTVDASADPITGVS